MGQVGVLALQGCIEPHLNMLQKIGATSCEVRSVADLGNVDRLIIPGGESTTMLKLLNSTGLYSAVQEFGRRHPIWGICAGAILICKEVIHPDQQSMKLIAVRATRNFYGSQTDSFKAKIEIDPLDKTMEVDFIRAPLLEPINSREVTVLARHNERPVLMQHGKILVSSFHTELGDDPSLHQYFLGLR
jgi:5'-phosphate synthase pdxT subunit